VQVTQAVEEFSYEGTAYPQGSYIVWMNQPKRGLANTILDSGPDLSPIEGLSFYSPPSVWSQPLLWGVHRVEIEDENFSALTNDVKQAPTPLGSVDIPNVDYYTYAPDTLAAFQATNELLGGDALVYFAAEPYEDDGKSFGAGSLIVPATYANDLSHRFALDLLALGELPTTAVQMKSLKIAVNGDEGVLHALQVLGFEFDEISAQDINAGLITDYDLFINQGQSWSGTSQRGKAALSDFFSNGGDYIGLGVSSSSVGFAINAGIIYVEYETSLGNAIVQLKYDATPVSAGFDEQDYAFVYGPGWFTEMGTGVEIAASYAQGDFLESGYWPGWENSGAAGQPVKAYAATLTDWLQSRKINVVINDISPDLDIIIVLGGDGTLLHIAEQAARYSIPVLGINLGNLGFLTELTENETFSTLEYILNNQVTIENRLMLKEKRWLKILRNPMMNCWSDILKAKL